MQPRSNLDGTNELSRLHGPGGVPLGPISAPAAAAVLFRVSLWFVAGLSNVCTMQRLRQCGECHPSPNKAASVGPAARDECWLILGRSANVCRRTHASVLTLINSIRLASLRLPRPHAWRETCDCEVPPKSDASGRCAHSAVAAGLEAFLRATRPLVPVAL